MTKILRLVFALGFVALLPACSHKGGGNTCSINPAAPSCGSVTPKWSELRSLNVSPNPVGPRSSLKIDALYMVNQSGLAYNNVWSIRYPDGHEEEFAHQSGTTQVPVLSQDGTAWSVLSSAKVGDYAVIYRRTESLNDKSNSSALEAPFIVQ